MCLQEHFQKTPLSAALLPPCRTIPVSEGYPCVLGLEAGPPPSNDHKPVLTLSTLNRKEAGRPGLLHMKKQYHRLEFILSYMDVNNLIRCKQWYLILATARARRTLHGVQSYQGKLQRNRPSLQAIYHIMRQDESIICIELGKLICIQSIITN